MQQASTAPVESGGLSSIFSSVNKWLLKWPGLAGTPFYIFYGNALHNAYQATPDAALSSIFMDGSVNFYSTIADACMNGLFPVLEIAAKASFNAAADAIMPGSSLVLEAFTYS